MAKRKTSSTKKGTHKNSLVENINIRKKSKTSRSKKSSTISDENYDQMKRGWPKSAAKKKASTKRKSSSKKKAAKKKSTKSSKLAKSPKRSKRTAKKAKKPLKDPEGGLTAAGRQEFLKRDGSHLKPGVQGPANTPEKMRRKGSFLRRHIATLRGPLVDDQGNPTRLALQAHAWGEPIPKTLKDAERLASKGTKLLEQYKRSKD